MIGADWSSSIDRSTPFRCSCCNQRLLIELLSFIADADTDTVAAADRSIGLVAATSYQSGLIRVASRRVAAASIDLSNQRLLIKRLLIKLLSPIASPIAAAISVY